MLKKWSCFYVSILLLSTICFPILAQAKVWDAYSIMEHPVKNMCALTFDDGPSDLSPQFLDALKEQGVKGTFFVLGMQAARYPNIIKRMVEEGHEVASHGYAHSNLPAVTSEAAYKDIKKTYDVLERLGVKAKFFRPPYGKYNRNVISMVKKLDMSLILWSVDSRDWETKPDYGNMPNILNRPMSAEEMRGIFLFHDTKKRTVNDIKLIIMILRAMGCSHFVTVSEYFEEDVLEKLIDQAPRMIPRPDLRALTNEGEYKNTLDFNWEVNNFDKVMPKNLLDDSKPSSSPVKDFYTLQSFEISLDKK